MKIYGRTLLDSNREPVPLDNIDDIVFNVNGMEIVVSLYRARIDGRIEVRANDGLIIVSPRAANVVEIETRR